ncbi:MAG: sigma-70 family RNA polymerase sigma factor, partial [Labilithrix sp.]|nr:sigma-70 family RNA polymerase sigma factor [Labilithrix sp.]
MPRRPSLRELFDAHRTYVQSSLGRLGVPRADRDDAVQDVFLTVNDLLDDFDSTRPFRPWVFAIVYRVALRHHRRRWRRREELAAPEQLASRAQDDEAVGARTAREIVARAVAAMEARRRTVFVLKEIDGCAMAEIAARLGIPVNTAYSRLRLARREFRDAVTRLDRRPIGQGPPATNGDELDAGAIGLGHAPPGRRPTPRRPREPRAEAAPR